MAEYNKVILLGNLTRDPELRYTPSGLPVCEFSLAVHSHHRSQEELKEEVCFIDVVAFGKIGERTKSFGQKGSRVLIDGRLAQRRWDGPDGRTRSKHEVVATTVQFFDRGAAGNAATNKSDND